MFFTPALLALLTTLTAAASRARQETCHNYVIISVRGTYEGQGPSIAFPGMINQTLTAVSGGIEYDARYPASPNQTAYLGAEDVVRYIDSGLQECPSQRYALLGYSQGASALRIALRNYTDTQSAGYNAIRSILVVGNPYHKPNASVNIDQNGTDTTRALAGSGYRPNQPDAVIPDIFYTDGKLLDICYARDVVCGPTYPGATFIPDHLRYGSTPSVQDIGGRFMIERLQQNATTTSTTMTMTTPAPTGSSTTLPTGSSTTSTPTTSTSPTSQPSAVPPNAATREFPAAHLYLPVLGLIAFL